MTERSTILIVKSGNTLKGTTIVPGDKSISHRALMLGALAEGTNTVHGWLPGGDNLATLEVIRALGIDVKQDGTTLIFDGGKFSKPDGPLDCVNAGTLMRLIAGLLVWQPFESVLDGSPQLRARPMKRITEPLRELGADITDTDGKAPLTIRPATIQGGEMHPKIASAQVKSALLLAGLGAKDEVIVHEPGPSRDHTERMLASMGADIYVSGRTVHIGPLKKPLKPLNMTVPGDMSSAAFVIVAATILPESDIEITGVGLNPTRNGILEVLANMEAYLEINDMYKEGGEDTGTVRVKYDPLFGMSIGGGLVVRAIDEIPIIAVAATQATGKTAIKDAAELRVKEVDRISLLSQELRKMGAQIEEQPDGMIVTGPTKLHGAEVSSHGDHRLGMALAVAGLAAEGETHVDDAACIADSFPGFVDLLTGLGADMREQ